MKSSAFLISLTVLVACSGDEHPIPADSVPVNQLIPLLADIHLANAQSDAMRSNDDSGSTRNDSLSCIKNGIDQKRYETTMAWYKEHPEELSKVYEEVINELSRRQSETTGTSAH